MEAPKRRNNPAPPAGGESFRRGFGVGNSPVVANRERRRSRSAPTASARSSSTSPRAGHGLTGSAAGVDPASVSMTSSPSPRDRSGRCSAGGTRSTCGGC